jgi:hypothetical protein
MNIKFRTVSAAGLAGIFILAMSVAAQGNPQAVQQTSQTNQVSGNTAGGYDAARETVITGTVVQYSAKSATAPMGARVSLQTSSGVVDVHLGNAKFLEINHFSLQAGEAVRATGENVALRSGTIFVARSVQKGSQVVMLRSKNGIPLMATAAPANGKARVPGGAR